MKSIRRIGSFAALFAVALLATDAHATEVAQTVPGIACYRTGGGVRGELAGTVSNTSSTSELNVSCPIQRDGDLALIAGSNFLVFDRHPNIAVTCALASSFAQGAQLFSVAESKSTAAGFFSSNVTSITGFGTLAGGDFYHAACTVPRTFNGSASHVVRIRMRSNHPAL